MATGQTLIDRSLRLLGQIGAGKDPTSDESNDALEAVNAMLDDWRNEGLMTYAFQEESLTLANADASYTIGTGGDLNTTRPVAIEAAWIVDDDVSHTVLSMTEDEYAGIADKTTSGDWPTRYLYRPTMATGTLIVWPVPNATRTLKLRTRVPLAALSLAGTVSLPPGWEKAISANLALEIAPEYEVSPAPEVIKMAQEAKANIKRINHRAIKASTGIEHIGSGGYGNILTDQ